MEKQRLDLEYELASSSVNIIWSLISSAAGLEKWMADSVTRSGDTFSFMWGEPWRHHETRTATVVEEAKAQHIRLRWSEDEATDAYWQLRLEKSDITNDYILCITDYALSEDIDSLREIWDSNIERLHRVSGL